MYHIEIWILHYMGEVQIGDDDFPTLTHSHRKFAFETIVFDFMLDDHAKALNNWLFSHNDMMIEFDSSHCNPNAQKKQ